MRQSPKRHAGALLLPVRLGSPAAQHAARFPSIHVRVLTADLPAVESHCLESVALLLAVCPFEPPAPECLALHLIDGFPLTSSGCLGTIPIPCLSFTQRQKCL